jgi:hypothetical protein
VESENPLTMACASSYYNTFKVNSANASCMIIARISASTRITFAAVQKVFHQDYNKKKTKTII